MFEESCSDLQVIRIEITKHNTIYLYYRPYLKDSKNFPDNYSFIIFYFDHEITCKDIIKEYFNLISKVDKISLGSFINKYGSIKKRRTVNYALLKFKDKIHNINRKEFQDKVTNYIENNKNKKVKLDFNINEVYSIDSLNQDDVDEDGFVEVKASNNNKNKFTSTKDKDLSFKIIEKNKNLNLYYNNNEDSYMDIIRKQTYKKNKKINSGFFKKVNEIEEDNMKEKEIESVYGDKQNGYWNVQERENKKKSIVIFLIF